MTSCVFCDIKQFSRLKVNWRFGGNAVSVFCRASQSSTKITEQAELCLSLKCMFKVKIRRVSFLLIHFWLAVGQSFVVLWKASVPFMGNATSEHNGIYIGFCRLWKNLIWPRTFVYLINLLRKILWSLMCNCTCPIQHWHFLVILGQGLMSSDGRPQDCSMPPTFLSYSMLLCLFLMNECILCLKGNVGMKSKTY